MSIEMSIFMEYRMIVQRNVTHVGHCDHGRDYSIMATFSTTNKMEFMKMGNGKVAGARTLKASEFKAKCLKLMDEVADSGAEIIITKNGHPVSRLVPYREKPKSLFGIDKGRFKILGDIIEPLDVEWEANAGRTWDSDK